MNPGVKANNQNYGLRATGSGAITFLFRNARNRGSEEADWHRWTSTTGFAADTGWHHIAVTYTFGKGDSLRGYIDSKLVKGKWDMGGKTDDGPYVDNDELWIGSSVAGNPNSGFNGHMNEVAIYRKALAAEQIARRFKYVPQKREIALGDIPEGKVLAELIENIPVANNFSIGRGKKTDSFILPAFGLTRLPFNYNRMGVRDDRSTAMLLRLAANIALPKGKHELLVRALNGSRLFIDGQKIVETKFNNGNTSGHGEVSPIPERLPEGLRFLRLGHNEKYFTWESDGKPHLFMHEVYVGGKGRRPDIGELSFSVLNPKDNRYHLMAPEATVAYSDKGWTEFARQQEAEFDRFDAKRRHDAAAKQNEYWAGRHQQAREIISKLPAIEMPKVSGKFGALNEIDQFIAAKLKRDDKRPASLTDDDTFLRRVAIDITGRIPTPDAIRYFHSLPSEQRRVKIIDHLLTDPGWADNWVSYWQDVLAENPAILKPSLNNTGPFRFYIHEAFTDNKSMDRFASELILMEGSTYEGGPAGFKLATQNDVPMADRAQIISQAFLGQNLACARCHDSPFHSHKQKQTFQLAAMLNRGEQVVPASSSLPGNASPRARRRIEVSIKPGDAIKAAWAFPKFSQADFLASFVQKPADTREQLAVHITNPGNLQFARTLVNRVWKRYLGLGIVEPVADWEDTEPSHPQLLEWLAREFVKDGYDMKILARKIFNSQTYQRSVVPTDDRDNASGDRWFASPQRRRMTAEQIVDSLFAAVGKELDSEMLTLDNDYRRAGNAFLNLGFPRRAWEYTTLSNDRDRPALSFPKTQAIVDVLKEFGWRETRQAPLSERDHSPNVLQPAVLANGDTGNGRVTRLSDNCEVTELCLKKQDLETLVTEVFRRALTRKPTGDELETFVELLNAGYAKRIVVNPKRKPREYDQSLLLSWSNHLNSRATEIKLKLEEEARMGDEPTLRLARDWRERMEDVLWALVNTPEFVFIP